MITEDKLVEMIIERESAWDPAGIESIPEADIQYELGVLHEVLARPLTEEENHEIQKRREEDW